MTKSVHPYDSASMREQTWRTRWLFVGGAFLALWYSVRFLDREWMSQWPPLLLLMVTGLAPQLFLILFPLLTRDKVKVRRIEVPRVKRCLYELAISVPIVIVTMIALVRLNHLVGVLSPSRTLTPDAATSMASSSPRYVYPILLLSITVIPVAEEVFFRGFLYNAFRKRMPTVLAGFLQSLIFGFCHFFETTHAVIAVALGLVITAVYEWRRTLVSPVLVHAGINFMFAVSVLTMMVGYADRPTIGLVSGPDDTECIVREVIPNSAASECGIMTGDLIVAFDGRPVANFSELSAAVLTRQPHDTVTLSLVRNGEMLDIEVKLKRRGQTLSP